MAASGGKGVSIIIAGVGVSTGLTVLRDLLYGNISAKPVIGGFVVGTLLLIVAFWSVEVSAAFALLMLSTSVLRNAPRILEKVELS